MIATVVEGRVVALRGDPDHPVTRGFLCERTNRDYPGRLHAPERLLRPLRRAKGGFEAISWDEALDLVAERMLRFRAESGPASLFHYRSGGSLGILKAVVARMFERFGPVTVKRGDVCSGAGEAAQEADFGISESNDLFDLDHARTIILWGKNPAVSSVHLLPILKAARSRGARVILIDPRRHRVARDCDLYLQPRPGSDGCLALGMARIALDRGWLHPEAPKWCSGWEGYLDLLRSREARDWLAPSGLEWDAVVQVAEAYAREGPSTILVGWGLQRRANGGATVRAVDALAAATGNLGIPGASVSFYFGRRRAFDGAAIGPTRPAPRTLLEPLLAHQLEAASDPPIRMVWIDLGNPVAMLPDSARLAAALRSREFVVVVDSFLTDTAQCADLVLPCATMLEEDDLLGAYGHHWLGEQRAVVAPPPGVRTDLEIVRALAPRLGLGVEFQRSAEEWKVLALRKLSSAGFGLEDLRRGAIRNPYAAEVVFAGRRFPTPDGRARLLREAPDPLPPLDREWPLRLGAFSAAHSQSSQGRRGRLPGPPEARVHPESAAGIPDGGTARVCSPLGSLEVILRHDPDLHPELLHMDKGGWLAAGRCANALTEARATDLGGGACYYDQPVRVIPRE